MKAACTLRQPGTMTDYEFLMPTTIAYWWNYRILNVIWMNQCSCNTITAHAAKVVNGVIRFLNDKAKTCRETSIIQIELWHSLMGCSPMLRMLLSTSLLVLTEMGSDSRYISQCGRWKEIKQVPNTQQGYQKLLEGGMHRLRVNLANRVLWNLSTKLVIKYGTGRFSSAADIYG